MGKGASPRLTPLAKGGALVVVVALNGPDDQPDPNTLRAFLATAAQGVSYDMGVWRTSSARVKLTLDHPLLTVDAVRFE
jgi:allantoicase